jgi:hypothetical protein
MKRTTKLLCACLLLGSAAAHASPITFEVSMATALGGLALATRRRAIRS